jgi:hypothetical protein
MTLDLRRAPGSDGDGPTAQAPPPTRLLCRYRPLAGRAGRDADAPGRAAPGLARVLRASGGAGSPAETGRFARGDQYLRDAGCSTASMARRESTERDLAAVSHAGADRAAEWQALAAGLVQRADLLEAVMADLYGPKPAGGRGASAAVAGGGQPGMAAPDGGDCAPRGAFPAFRRLRDRARPGWRGGCWATARRRRRARASRWKTGWRPRALLRALCRHAMCTAWPGSFREFRDALLGQRAEEGSRVAILTPGPLNDTYFEHAYIARYLGFMLLEGEDLTVQGGQVMVRTSRACAGRACCGGGWMAACRPAGTGPRHRASARRGWWRRCGGRRRRW